MMPVSLTGERFGRGERRIRENYEETSVMNRDLT
jgi:hypothetical protein